MTRPAAEKRRSFPLGLAVGSLAAGLATAAAMSGTVVLVKRWAVQHYTLRSAQAAQTARADAQESMDQHAAALKEAAREAAQSQDWPERFSETAARAQSGHPGWEGISFVDPDFKIRDVYPYAANRAALGLDLKSRFDVLAVANRAITRKELTASGLLELVQGGRGVLFYAPVMRPDRWVGFLEGVLRPDRFFAAPVEDRLAPEYGVTVIDERDGREVHSSLPPEAPRTSPLDTYFTLNAADRTWWVIVHPLDPPPLVLPLATALLLELGLGSLAVWTLWRRMGKA